MKRAGYQTALEWLAWGAARLGWPGLAGLALLILAVLACAVLVKPLEDDLEITRSRAGLLAGRPSPAAQASLERDWRADLPASHAGHAHLARLFAAARTAGLSLAEGRYQETKDANSGLIRLAISLPVSGKYPAIRAFIAHALSQQPGLALEGLRLSRDSLGDSEIQGDLHFVLFLGAKP